MLVFKIVVFSPEKRISISRFCTFFSRRFLLAKLLLLIVFILVLNIKVIYSAGKNITRSDEGKNNLFLLDSIRQTLKNHPNIQLHNEYIISEEGSLQSSQGTFDWQFGASLTQQNSKTPLSASNRIIYGNDYLEENVTTSSISLEKQLRSGIVISPSVETTISKNITTDSDETNLASVDFSVSIPLFKGGEEITTADIMTAQANLDYYRFTLHHQISEAIYETVKAYWDWLAAQKKLEVYINSENISNRLLTDIKTLIKADQKPTTDINQVEADRAVKKSNRVSAEQDIFLAGQTLILAMGSAMSNIQIPKQAADNFPELIDIIKLEKIKLPLHLDKIEQNRADFQASKQKEELAQIQVTVAEDNRRSALNLVLKGGYTGLEDGSGLSGTFDSLSRTQGVHFSISLQTKFPFSNNQALGVLIQRKSALRQSIIQTNTLRGNIRSSLHTAIENLKRTVVAVKNNRISIVWYRKSVENERLKLKNGMSTVIDLISLEERLQSELLKEISLMANYATALVRLRFETGTIVSLNSGLNQISKNQLMKIPNPDELDQ